VSTQPLSPLRALASGARPPAAATPARSPDAPDFQALLRQARAGEISSGRDVTVAKRAGVDLTPGQLARVARAADRAEASGALKALVLIDGQALVLDVPAREVVGSAKLDPGAVIAGVDAVVAAPPSSSAADPAPIPPSPPASGLTPALLRALRGPDSDQPGN
jgi:hypothetical protein